MGILDGLASFGLGNLENAEIFEDKKKKAEEAAKAAAAAGPVKIDERELILDKSFECPVCGNKFANKVMKTGRAKLLGTDQDLRPKYEGIESLKYDVVQCPRCGYTAIARFFPSISSAQAKLVREQISKNVHLKSYDGELYSYDDALERYQLALANAIVKRAKPSEKAFICLKSGWLLRGYAEFLTEEKGDAAKIEELKKAEDEYLLNAYNGFAEARSTEGFPMCGMDEVTIDYLLAVLATRFKKFDVASRLVASILGSSNANARTKDKARDLKDQIVEEIKKSKAEGTN